MADTESLTCYIHPNRETLLRCNRCEKPICTECAIQTPIGYRCPQCVRGQQKVFNTAKVGDLVMAPLAALVLSFAGSYFVSLLGFFTLILAPFVGSVIAGAVRQLSGRRRSKTLVRLTTAAVVIGSLPLLVMDILPLAAGIRYGQINIYSLIPLIFQAAYTILSTGSFYYRMAGISL